MYVIRHKQDFLIAEIWKPLKCPQRVIKSVKGPPENEMLCSSEKRWGESIYADVEMCLRQIESRVINKAFFRLRDRKTVGRQEQKLRGRSKCNVRREKLSGSLVAEGPSALKAPCTHGSWIHAQNLCMGVFPTSIMTKRQVWWSRIFTLHHNKMLVHTFKWLQLKMLIISSVGQDMEELELSYTTGGNIKLYNHFGK